MKISYVELSGFRGFRESTRLDFASGFVVLTGRNGAGKSTVLDAIDFVLTGTIEKYTVTNAKGGGLADHIWWMGKGKPTMSYVRVCFVDEDGREFILTRSPDHPTTPSTAEMAARLCKSDIGPDWARTLINTTLIRDETITKLSMDLPGQARFEAVRSAVGALAGPDNSARTASILEAAKASKTEQEARRNAVLSELSRALSSLTEARSVADRQSDVAEAESTIKRLAPDLDLSGPDITESMRRHIAERKQSISTLADLLARAETVFAEARRFSSSDAALTFTDASKRIDDLTEKQRALQRELEAAEAADLAIHQADEFAANMIALLSHGEQIGLVEGHCPLCGAVRSNSEFAASVAAARDRLAERGHSSEESLERLIRVRTAALENQSGLTSALETLRVLEGQRDRVRSEAESITKGLAALGITQSAPYSEAMHGLVLQRQEEAAALEHALYILEASAAHDRVAALEARVEKLRIQLDEEDMRSTTADRALEAAKLIDNAGKTVANQLLAEQFDTVMPLLRELYQRLRPHSEWRDIETDFGGKIRATLDFTVGEGKNPQFLFSSGQRRAAGLAFLLTIHLSRPWSNLQTLMLDDPVQHIDDFRALNLVEVLTAMRKLGRQVVVAVEDPLLADLLCRRLHSTHDQPGKRYDLAVNASGSAAIENVVEIRPLPRRVLELREAS